MPKLFRSKKTTEQKTDDNELDKNKETAPKNYWKISFLILLGLVVGSTAFIGTRIFTIREPDYKEIPKITQREGEPVLTINSEKEKVNELINFFLEDFQEDSDVKYTFSLENEAMLNGEFKILGVPIDFYLYFEPYVTENGNVQLKAKSLSVGSLNLPMKEAMRIVKKNYKLPSWVEVDPDELTVMIRLDKFRMQNGMYVKADKIDLVNDEIRFSLYLPAEE